MCATFRSLRKTSPIAACKCLKYVLNAPQIERTTAAIKTGDGRFESERHWVKAGTLELGADHGGTVQAPDDQASILRSFRDFGFDFRAYFLPTSRWSAMLW